MTRWLKHVQIQARALDKFSAAETSTRSFAPVAAKRAFPEPAHYFSRVEDMIYDVTCGKPEVDWEHVIIENIERLPWDFLHDHAPKGFAFNEPTAMTEDQRGEFFLNLGAAVRNDNRTYRLIKNRQIGQTAETLLRLRRRPSAIRGHELLRLVRNAAPLLVHLPSRPRVAEPVKSLVGTTAVKK